MEHTSTNKIAVVTGGFGYVGFEIVKELARNNFLVVVLYNTTPSEKVTACMNELEGEGHVSYVCNLQHQEEVKKCLLDIEKNIGTIFAYIHTAGLKPERKKISITSEQEFMHQIEGTTVTSFNFLTSAAQIVKDHKAGVIIGITTAGVVVPEATKSLGAYIPAKFAVQGILTMLKDELAASNVSVYSLAPGFMSGGMNADIPQAFVQMIQAKVVHGELMSAETVAKTVVTLLSGEGTNSLTMLLAPEYIS